MSAAATSKPLSEEDFRAMLEAGLEALRRPQEPFVPIMPTWWVRQQRDKT